MFSADVNRSIKKQIASGNYNYVFCNLCGDGNGKVYALRQEIKGGNNLHLRRDRCKTCGLVYSNPQASDKTLKNYYENEVYKDNINEISMKMHEHSSNQHLFWKRITDNCIKPGKFLDVGCNTGHFLSLGKGYGWDVYGVDLSEDAISYGQKELALENLQISDLYSAKYPDNFFDYVHCWHTLEHVTDPKSLLIEINRVMKKDAEFIVGVPGVTDPMYYSLRLINRLRNIPPPFSSDIAHCFEFTKSTLNKMLEKAGFNILETKVYYDSLNEILPESGWRYKIIVYFFWYLSKLLPNTFGNRLYGRAIKKRNFV